MFSECDPPPPLSGYSSDSSNDRCLRLCIHTENMEWVWLVPLTLCSRNFSVQLGLCILAVSLQSSAFSLVNTSSWGSGYVMVFSPGSKQMWSRGPWSWVVLTMEEALGSSGPELPVFFLFSGLRHSQQLLWWFWTGRASKEVLGWEVNPVQRLRGCRAHSLRQTWGQEVVLGGWRPTRQCWCPLERSSFFGLLSSFTQGAGVEDYFRVGKAALSGSDFCPEMDLRAPSTEHWESFLLELDCLTLGEGGAWVGPLQSGRGSSSS